MCNCSMKPLGISNESFMRVLFVYNISDCIKLTNLQLRLQDSEKYLNFFRPFLPYRVFSDFRL